MLVTSPVSVSLQTLGETPLTLLGYLDGTLLVSPTYTASLVMAPGAHTLTYETIYGDDTRWASSTFTVGTTASNVASQITNDMIGSNEANPQGWPTSWGEGPSMGDGNTPPSAWTASTAWGVVYQAAQGNMSTNTRVNIRNVQLYFLSKKTGTWSTLQNTSQPDCAAYKEDFSGDVDVAADLRIEADGTISVTSGMGVWAGDNIHFYPDLRGAIVPTDVAGVVSIFEARLIVGDTSLPDDRATANYVAEAGADYWPSLTGALPGSYNNVTPPVAGGKYKYVQNDWRSFSMTTMTQAALALNPPPVNLTADLP
jgi:hypothetical protein